jgi:hypothetical protein
MPESAPRNPEESDAPEDLAKDIVSMQQGPEAAQDEAHVSEVAEKLSHLKGLFDQRDQQ